MPGIKDEAIHLARRTVKGAAAVALHYSGVRNALSTLQRRAVGGRRVLILSYHRVVGDIALEARRGLPTLNISQETFRKHLETVRETHDIVRLDDALDILDGTRRASRDVAVITFDDGYRDVYTWAYPVMKAMKVPAVVYVPSNFIGTTDMRLGHDRLWAALVRMRDRRVGPLTVGVTGEAEQWLQDAFRGAHTPNKVLERLIGKHSTQGLYKLADALEEKLGLKSEPVPEGQTAMSWEMLREMDAHGVETGGHTADHTVLTNSPLADAHREVAECKKVIEKNLGKPIHHFAYCNGYYSAGVAQALRDEGFRSGVTTEDMSNVPGTNPFALKRKVLWENSSAGIFGTFSKSLAACQMNDTFGILSVQTPVMGARPTNLDSSEIDHTNKGESAEQLAAHG
jgi:peptidoglycan/xylan/chitin deacetylase (PgdA/CDA1 family)